MWNRVAGVVAQRFSASSRLVGGVRFATVNANQIRTGMALDFDGKIYRVIKHQHVKPGKGGAYVNCDLKEIKTGNKITKRLRSSESVAQAPLGRDQKFQFLYRDGEKLCLMHGTTFEQLEISCDLFSARQLDFLVEGMDLNLQILDSDVLWATMPEYVIMTVVQTTPKGVADTALSVKDAKLSNGAIVKVPLFIETGNQVRVATTDGSYVDKL